MSPKSSSVKSPARVSVLVSRPFQDPFDYTCERHLFPGDVVKVPFGKKELLGVVVDEPNKSPPPKLKEVSEVFVGYRLPEESMKFMNWVSEYTLAPRGQILKMMLPVPEVFTGPVKKVTKPEVPTKARKVCLSQDQKVASQSLLTSLESQTFKTFLLEGVTGSGKTEVYFEVIDSLLQKERGQALVLLPEIALSAQWLQRFQDRFGFKPVLWHSDVPKAQRREAYRSLLKGEARVIVGARSALFLPFPDLQFVVVDEEHDGSFKQEEGVIYNARDMAIVRAQLSQATCVLASATPSLESEFNVSQGKYTPLHLESRYGGASLPEVKLVDMRKLKRKPDEWLSPALREALGMTLERGEQSMLFLNRRGYAPLILCQACGERMMCPHCAVSLVQHKKHNRLLCHHCGYTITLPKACPSCQEEGGLSPLGPGVERLEEEVCKLFPEARVSFMTSDHLTTAKKIREQVESIQNHKVDILIGTQIMAKGHHFPLLTLVGIVDGDAALSGADLRASEKTYQILHQVAGRSGREAKAGQVYIQTHAPDHPVMQALQKQNRSEFFQLEAQQRELHGFPPFGRLVALILSGRNADTVQRVARDLARSFPFIDHAELLGPTPAPLSYLRGNYRWRLLLRTEKNISPQQLLRGWISHVSLPSTIKLQIDVDPYSFY